MSAEGLDGWVSEARCSLLASSQVSIKVRARPFQDEARQFVSLHVTNGCSTSEGLCQVRRCKHSIIPRFLMVKVTFTIEVTRVECVSPS